MINIKTFTKDKHIIRITTTPYQGIDHTLGGVIYIGCSNINMNISCTVCDDNHIRRRYWLIGAIDRETNENSIYRIEYYYFNQIRTFAKDVRWGDPAEYDLEIHTHPIKIFALSKKPLSERDKALPPVDIEAMKKTCEPWSEDRVKKSYENFKEKLAVL